MKLFLGRSFAVFFAFLVVAAPAAAQERTLTGARHPALSADGRRPGRR